ncbi:hypothetical protein Chor_006844, partial [Crotalus horridus]
LIQATNETNVNIPQMADTLFERATNSSWVVVFKALVTTHHLMVHGNEVHPNELTNGVINAGFMLLFKDLIKLFACYNDGVINLLEKFFEMKKGQCKDALEIYKRFLTRMARVSEFLKVAEQVGIDKGDIPDLTQAPSSLMETLEQHLNNLEGKKPGNNASKLSSDLLDLQPDFTSGPAQAASAAPPGGTTSWGGSGKFQSERVRSQVPVIGVSCVTCLDRTLLLKTLVCYFGLFCLLFLFDLPVWTHVDSLAGFSSVTSEPQISDPFAPEPTLAPPAATAESATTSATTAAAAAEVDLFGDAFAASPGEASAATEGAAAPATPTPVAAALDACSGNGGFHLISSSVVGVVYLFESTPADAPPPPKSDGAPSIDLFGTDTFSSPATGVSPGPENSLTGDLLSVDAFAAPSSLPTASPAEVDSSGVIDLFGDAFGSAPSEPQPAVSSASSTSASADLLAGFGGSFIAPSPSPSPITPAQANILQPNFEAAFGAAPTPAPAGSSFDPSVFDGLGDLLMPTTMQTGQPLSNVGTATASASAATKAIGSDLDSSLANLVGNLGISGTTSKKGDLQWSAGEKKLTGGANWQPKVAPATWSSGVPPSGPLTGSVPPAAAGTPTSGAASPQTGSGFGMQPPAAGVGMMPQQPLMYGQPMMRPPFGAAAGPGAQISPSPTPATQSPKKPPTKDPLADLNIKDFL